MQFQKYINHNIQHSTETTKANNPKLQQRPRVIKFVGNMQENIKQLLQGINCHCGNKKEFYSILVVFANKIEKLRTEREHYKNTLKEYLITMNSNSTSGQSAKKHKKSETERKVKGMNKQEIKESTKIYISSKENQTPLRKVANLFLKDHTKPKVNNDCQISFVNESFRSKNNQQTRNHLTAIKRVFMEDMKQVRTEDKRLRDCQQIKKEQSPLGQQVNDDSQFSLNLSEFEDAQKRNQTTQFTKEISSIMSETNLLDSDEEESTLFRTPSKKQQSLFLPSLPHINQMKMTKHATDFEEILLSLNDQQCVQETKPSAKKNKKKQNPEDPIIHKKSIKKSEKLSDKQNIKAESCLKKYNISIEKLEEFIQNKECLKQLQKTQEFDLNLKNFKTNANFTLRNNIANEFDSVTKTIRPGRPLEERKFNFNI